MDLLVEKVNNKTYLSQLGFLVTSFEEGAPAIARNRTNIQGRSGSVDFGGWHESKKVNLEGFYRAEDQYEEETLKKRLFALLSDPEGIYNTEMRGEIGQGFERPGETEGEVYEHMITRPSHKRFYVYASSIENEFQGNVGGTVLYKMSVEFTTLKLPYGESVPRDLNIKPNLPQYSKNLALNTTNAFKIIGNDGTNQSTKLYNLSGILKKGTTVTVGFDIVSTTNMGTVRIMFPQTATGGSWEGLTETFNLNTSVQHIIKTKIVYNDQVATSIRLDNATGTVTVSNFIISTTPSRWNPNPADSEYGAWYTKIYYNTDNLVIPYAGTVHCNQLEQGFTIEFTAKEAGSRLVIDVNGTKLTYNGQVYSGDVVKLSGYEYTKNDISIVKYTN